MPWTPRTFLALLVASMGCWLERQAGAQIAFLKAEQRLFHTAPPRYVIDNSRTIRAQLRHTQFELGTIRARSAQSTRDRIRHGIQTNARALSIGSSMTRSPRGQLIKP